DFVLKREDLLQRHALSPYMGASFRGLVKQTVRRGETIFAEGRAMVSKGGRLVRPEEEGRCVRRGAVSDALPPHFVGGSPPFQGGVYYCLPHSGVRPPAKRRAGGRSRVL